MTIGQGASIPNYDVTRDWRFIMLRRDSQGISRRVVIHWAKELKTDPRSRRRAIACYLIRSLKEG
jgi:hypothetical protein